MTFVEILNDIYDRTGQQQASAVDPVVARRIKRFVNTWHRKIISRAGLEPVRRIVIFLSSVVAQQTYGVVAHSLSFMTEATTQRKLDEMTLGWYRQNVPDPTRWNGTPLYWVNMGRSRIKTRPSAPCQLFIQSTVGGDVGLVNVEAVRSNGYLIALSQALAGLVPTAMAGATDVIDITSITLPAAQTGIVTITQGSGGAELSRLQIGQTTPRFLRIALVPTPSQVIAYTIDGIADTIDLVADFDEPLFDVDYHHLLVDGGVYEEWITRGRGDDAGPLRAEMELRINELICSLVDWPERGQPKTKTFDESIREPIA